MMDDSRSQGLTARNKTLSPALQATLRRFGGHRTTLGLAALLGVLVARYIYWNEGSGANVVYVASLTALLTCALILLTCRVLLSVAVVSALTAIIVSTSTQKVELMNMAIHAYDIVYYLSSFATLEFLFTKYTWEMVQLFGALVALGLLAILIHRVETTRVPRLYSAAGILALALLTYTAAQSKDARTQWRLFEDGLALTKFYGSWPETLDTLWRGQLIEADIGPGTTAPIAMPARCVLDRKPPHVILIHEESVVPPEYFPALSYDKSLDKMFRSDDGALHKLRVETYAGASWLTEFSILAGVSTYSFGSMRPFVQALMAGKVHDTLPEVFARCGYRNVVFYPLNRNFVSNGRFYEAAGMDEIFDMKDQRARLGGERDSFYFGNALRFMESHFASSKAPLFTYVITMATHQPYTKPFMPEVNVPGGGPGTDPGMNEFLRRLGMARIDLDAFKKELARRFPAEKFLIVHYGDHQPTSTWSYLAPTDHDAIRSGDRGKAATSPAFLTYYAVHGVNFDVPKLPQHDTLDVPYLGLTVLDAAGLPLSPSYRERKELMQVCDGRYDGCQDRSRILSFHRRLIDSGLLDAR